MTAAPVVRLAVVFVLAAGLAGSAPAPDTKAAPAHLMVQDAEVVWGPGPAALPPGGKAALLSGDPGQPGPYTLRSQLPAGYRIPPHWHPNDEHVTVLSGTFAMGMGETFDASALKDLKPGGFARMPAEMRHFAVARTDTVLQIHGTGPFAITYVNPADDPRNAAKK